MAVVSRKLQVELAQDFFNTVTKVRAYGYYDAVTSGANSQFQFADNTISISMIVDTDLTNTGAVATLDTGAGENPILITVAEGDEFVVHELQFLNEDETITYFAWEFTTVAGSEELKYTGNGELHLENINFTIQ